MAEEIIRVIITKGAVDSMPSVLIMKGQNKMTSFSTFTRRGARRAADRYLKTRGKYTHPVQYTEFYT